jgi:FAD/FMN-containing dehydrogenase
MRTDERVTSPKGMLAYFIPNSSFPDAYKEINLFLDSRVKARGLAKHGVSVSSSFRPNGYTGVYVNTMIVYDGSSEAGREAVRLLLGEAYSKVVELGASPEPHQGNTSPFLQRSWSAGYRSFMRQMKLALDPECILNPGLWDLESSERKRRQSGSRLSV